MGLSCAVHDQPMQLPNKHGGLKLTDSMSFSYQIRAVRVA